MKTIKLPIQNNINLNILQNQYNSALKYSFNRFQEGYNQKQIRALCKNLNNIEVLDSWFLQNAIKDAEYIYAQNKDEKVIFGGKKLFEARSKKQISKEEFQERRKLPISVQAERHKYGNRKFNLDIINNNQIIFKFSRNTHIPIQLPKLKKNYSNQLTQLELLSKQKEIGYSVKLDEKYIWITFDESELNLTKKDQLIENRIASIDMNPNYIGFYIYDYEQDKQIYKEVISIKSLNDIEYQLKGLPSTDKRKKYLNNKRKHEIVQICKRLSIVANHYKCQYFGYEKLNMPSKDNKKGKKFNKLINNTWNRNLFIHNLTKRLNNFNIKTKKILPQYSSFIGSINYPSEPDSIGAAIEINRRTFELKNYDKENPTPVIFPSFDKTFISNRWKNEKLKSILSESKDWKDFYNKIKKSEMKYRFLLSEYLKKYSPKVFSLKSYNSYIFLYSLL